MFELQKPTEIQELKNELLTQKEVRLFIKREDQIDPCISGNKFRKLKYNFLKAEELGYKTILTFGGAYSNHIHALAYAGNKYSFQTIGIIRGERIEPLNPTLKDSVEYGMRLEYISREHFRKKDDDEFIHALKDKFGVVFIVPEGGSNTLAVEGCEEIIDEIDMDFDIICCSCGTGGTLAGIISGLKGDKKVLGFPVLKGGEFLKKEIDKLILERNSRTWGNWELITDYHFGGYAKYNWDLASFINKFKMDFRVQLDPVYTGKMMFGIFDLLEKDFFKKGSTLLAIHTGGLQGIRGFNERFGELIK